MLVWIEEARISKPVIMVLPVRIFHSKHKTLAEIFVAMEYPAQMFHHENKTHNS
jgi:hypothetical protein